MALSKEDAQLIADMIAAKNAQGTHCEKQHKFRKRLIVTGCAIAATRVTARILHLEQAHEAVIVAIDGFVACNIDKFIYGLA